MPSAKDLTPDSRFMALFAGPSRNGKKNAACSWLPGPIKYLDFDMRIRGILGSTWLDLQGTNEVNYNSYPVRSDELVFNRLNKDLEGLYTEWKMGQCKYKTIVVGSITGCARALLADSHLITASGNDGKTRSISRNLGPLKVAGIENFRFINNGVMQLLGFLQSIPLNLIVLGHTIPIYSNIDENNPYSEKEITGWKLNMSDSLGGLVPGLFDNVFRFENRMVGSRTKYEVEFKSSFGGNTFGIPEGKHDITGKNFYNYFQGLVNKK